MKGILLAGGTGSRLFPLTKGVNKHLLPLGNQPMICHPLAKLVEAGVKDVLLITGPEHLNQFAMLLGDGSEWGCNIHFRVQQKVGGIADALRLARSFAGSDSFWVLLGDNIFSDSLQTMRASFLLKEEEAFVALKEVPDPERFGIAEIVGKKITKVVEKPKNPKSNLCVTGIYAYTPSVFKVIEETKPSGRGELEISDVNQFYAQAGRLQYHILDGWWSDAGTKESLEEAIRLVKGKKI